MLSVALRLLLVAGIHRVSNNWMELVLSDGRSPGTPGSVLSLVDLTSGVNLVTPGEEFSAVMLGDGRPMPGEVFLTDSSAVFVSPGITGPSGDLPIFVTISYTLAGRGLEIVYGLRFLQEVELPEPLEAVFSVDGWGQVSIENQTGPDDSFPLDGSTGFQRFSGSQIVRLSGGEKPGAMFLFPIVPKGIFRVEDSGSPEIGLLFFDTDIPRENCQGPLLHSLVPRGETREYYARITLDSLFRPVFVGNHPDGLERTAAWMMDELPLIHPDQGYIWGYSETADGPEPVSAAMIRLLEEHPGLKMDWLILPDAILTPNRDSAWAEPGMEDSWSHWHCTWRISTEATPEYLQWLRNIQNHVYPWSKRITMGCHGYHHTPNADSSFGQFHEFITYEPMEHQERLTMAMADIAAIGLDPGLVNVIRFPGHRTSLSGLRAVIDHGFVFYCNGFRPYDSFAGRQFWNQWLTMFETPAGRIWGSNTVWWADLGQPYLYDFLSVVMDRGKFGLLGAHPIGMLGGGEDPAAYHRIDSVLTSLEEDYPHFGWLFPIEYASHIEACYNLSVLSVRDCDETLRMAIEGEIPSGLTFCALLDPADRVEKVVLDGLPLEWEVRDGHRLFAVSRWREPGRHLLEVRMKPARQPGPDSTAVFLRPVNPSVSGNLEVVVFGGYPSEPVPVVVYDLAGRVVFNGDVDMSSGKATIRVPGGLPSGVYWIRAVVDGRHFSVAAVLLR